MARKIVKNFALDQQLVTDLERLAEARQESMSLIVREALRSHIRAQIGAER